MRSHHDEIERIRCLKGDAQRNALVAFIDQWHAELEAVVAKMHFVLRLETDDGCVKLVQWQGAPPDTFASRMKFKGNAFDYAEPGACPTARVRMYQLVDRGIKTGIARYEEIGNG